MMELEMMETREKKERRMPGSSGDGIGLACKCTEERKDTHTQRERVLATSSSGPTGWELVKNNKKPKKPSPGPLEIHSAKRLKNTKKTGWHAGANHVVDVLLFLPPLLPKRARVLVLASCNT